MNDPIPKISIAELSALLGAALGTQVDARDLHDVVQKRPPSGAPPQLTADDLFERYFRAAPSR